MLHVDLVHHPAPATTSSSCQSPTPSPGCRWVRTQPCKALKFAATMKAVALILSSADAVKIKTERQTKHRHEGNSRLQMVWWWSGLFSFFCHKTRTSPFHSDQRPLRVDGFKCFQGGMAPSTTNQTVASDPHDTMYLFGNYQRCNARGFGEFYGILVFGQT